MVSSWMLCAKLKTLFSHRTQKNISFLNHSSISSHMTIKKKDIMGTQKAIFVVSERFWKALFVMPLTSTHKSFNQFQDSFEVNMTFSCITRQANFNLGNKCNSFSYSIKTWPEPNYNDTAADTISMITIQQQKRCFEGSFAFGLMLGLLVLPAAASNNRQVFVRLTYDFSRFERWG